MKKLSLILTLAILLTAVFSTNVFALNVGDKLGDVLSTDIKTYINDERIPCYNINNKSVVVAEDLANYGFDVAWDSSSRTLSITRNQTKKFEPAQNISNNTAQVGSVAFSYVYTDITAVVNQRKVESFNIKGQTCIFFSDLEDYGTFKWDNNERASKLILATSSKPIEPKITAPGVGVDEKLKDYAFQVKRNSADGIVVTWVAKNNTGKELKYYTLNFSMWNPVGDPAICQIKKTNKSSIRFVGPVPIDSPILCYDHIIGYSAACSKVVLDTIDLEYMDGTTETIVYGYSNSR